MWADKNLALIEQFEYGVIGWRDTELICNSNYAYWTSPASVDTCIRQGIAENSLCMSKLTHDPKRSVLDARLLTKLIQQLVPVMPIKPVVAGDIDDWQVWKALARPGDAFHAKMNIASQDHDICSDAA